MRKKTQIEFGYFEGVVVTPAFCQGNALLARERKSSISTQFSFLSKYQGIFEDNPTKLVQTIQ